MANMKRTFVKLLALITVIAFIATSLGLLGFAIFLK